MENKNIDYVLPVIKNEKKDKKPKKRIYIVCAIVLVVLMAVGSLFLFAPNLMMPKSALKGTWELTVNPDRIVEDEKNLKESERTFYELSKMDSDGKGTWKTYNNGCVEEGKYFVFDKDGKDYINFGGNDLEYKLEGNKNFNNAKLTLVFPEQTSSEYVIPSSTYVLEQAESPEYDTKTYDGYKTESKLLGEWKTNERELQSYAESVPCDQTVTFNDNGIMTSRCITADGPDILCYYAYTVKGDKLTFSLVTDLKTKYTVGYKIDADGKLRFLDDTKSQDPVFGGAVLGDFNYYRPEKLPKRVEKVDESSNMPAATTPQNASDD